MSLADFVAYSVAIGGVLAIIGIIWNYAKNLRHSPRDMWFLFLYNLVEYSAYGAMNMAIILWLTADCGLGDVAAGGYIAAWSMMLSVLAMVVGAVVDTIGIRKTLIISIFFLMVSRFFMAFVTNPVAIFVLGFIPLAIGFAIVGPMVSVAIKRYTTKEGAALGFGLFYVLMNLAYAIGGGLFDVMRDVFGEKNAMGVIINENFGTEFFGMHFSTYQLFFLFGLFATVASLLISFLIRDGVELKDDGTIEVTPLQKHGSGLAAVKNASIETGTLISRVVREKYFWIFIGMLTITIPVRAIFFHFHYTFPKYGVRLLGEGARIGSIFGVLNPVLIIYMVPLVAAITKKTSSYKMMIIGSIISTMSCFIVAIPEAWFEPLTTSFLGELVFVKALRMAPDMAALAANPPIPAYWTLIFFITVFTVGEAIWSPRLMQFTAEIAPKGKEGTYIALSVLPWFAAKFVVGPMSGILVAAYTPLDEAGKALSAYPDHFMVWVWIGGMALLTPICLLLFRNLFQRSIEDAPDKVDDGGDSGDGDGQEEPAPVES